MFDCAISIAITTIMLIPHALILVVYCKAIIIKMITLLIKLILKVVCVTDVLPSFIIGFHSG